MRTSTRAGMREMVAQVSTSISSNARALGKSRRDIMYTVHSIRIFCNGSFSSRAVEMDVLPPAPFFQCQLPRVRCRCRARITCRCQMEPEARQVPTARALAGCSSHGSRHEGKEQPWLAWSNYQSIFFVRLAAIFPLFLFSSTLPTTIPLTDTALQYRTLLHLSSSQWMPCTEFAPSSPSR
jgi:hypothetical protein